MSDMTRSDAMLFEELESRVMLSYNPATFPDIGDLVSSDNTVIRMKTDYGFIDIELFDRAGPDGTHATAAPITAGNFLNYIMDGDFDGSFFHRLADFDENDPGNNVLQGGGFKFDDDLGLSQVPVDSPIVNEFEAARSNVERTIAMAKQANQPDSATSQWFFNVKDNSETLDDDPNVPDQSPFGNGDNGGFSVFGRVVNDASWDVVMTISNLETFLFADLLVDENGELVVENQALVPLEGGDPLANALQEVPITEPIVDPGPGELRSPLLSEQVLVDLFDVEVIKSAGTSTFFINAAYFPEGFANGHSTDKLTITNLNESSPYKYQVILRYETGDRDQVVASGTMQPNVTQSFIIHNNTNDDAGVRTNTPYAYEIQINANLTFIAASIEHTDFGSTSGEQFVIADDYTPDELNKWVFTGVEKREGEVASFIVWQNTTDNDATVTATFYDLNQDGPEATLVFPVGSFRRGGINIGALDQLADGQYAVVLTSDQPIIAAASHYENLPSIGAASVTDAYAFMSIGSAGDGSDSHVIPSMTFTSEGDNVIQIFNDAGQNNIVTITGVRDDGTTVQLANTTVSAKTARLVDLSGLIDNDIVADGETLAITLKGIGDRPFYAQFHSLVDGDMQGTDAISELNQITSFSGVFYDPNNTNGIVDTISIFNPKSGSGEVVRYRVDVLFSNGERIDGELTNLAPFSRVDLTIADLPNADAIIQRLNQADVNLTFSLSIGVIDPSDISAAVGIVQLTRTNNIIGYSWTTLGRNSGNEAPFQIDDNGDTV